MTDVDAAVLKALAYGLIQDRIAAGDRLNRQDLLTGMGVEDRKAVRLPLDGESVKVGSVTHANGSVSARITDEDALLAWAKEHRPDAVVKVYSTELREWFKDEMLALAKKHGCATDTETGEVIPGVEATVGASKIVVNRDKSPEAQAALVEAIFATGAAGLRSLLAIEPPE